MMIRDEKIKTLRSRMDESFRRRERLEGRRSGRERARRRPAPSGTQLLSSLSISLLESVNTTSSSTLSQMCWRAFSTTRLPSLESFLSPPVALYSPPRLQKERREDSLTFEKRRFADPSPLYDPRNEE
eukprot:scaffold34125_cov36-Tisochrysis_lutea.AAC.3